MNSKINTGLLAYGMSGKVFHAPFINAHAGFNFTAIVERTNKLAQQAYPNIKSYNTVEELIADQAIELVIINTPNFTHYDYAKMALNAGKHILVEKPFTATSVQAIELFELAQSVGKKALVYQNRRFDSGYHAVKDIIDSGKLGKLIEVHFRYDRYRTAIGPKSFKEEVMPATGLQYDLGPHLLDQAISLFGKPIQFHKILGKNRSHTKVDDYLAIQLSYPNDLNVFLTASMLVADIKEAFILNGSEGSFSKNHADVQEAQLLKGMLPSAAGYGIEDGKDAGKLTLISPNGVHSAAYIPSKKGDYMELFNAVYQTITHHMPYPITTDDIIAQLEILER